MNKDISMKLSDAINSMAESVRHMPIEAMVIVACRTSDYGTSVFRWNVDKEEAVRLFKALGEKGLDDSITVTGKVQ